MKFTIQFITLLATASSVFAAESTPVDTSQLNENDVTSFPLDSISESCILFLNSLNNCFVNPVLDSEKFEGRCTTFASEQCQKFENTSAYDVPECKDVNKSILFGIDELIKVSFQATKFECGKDENGNYCPLTSITLEKNYQYNKVANDTLTEPQVAEIYDKAMADTCKFKKCSDDLFTFVNEMSKDAKVIVQEAINSESIPEKTKKEREANIKEEQIKYLENFDVNKVNNYLKKENCLSEEAVKNSNTTSGAIQVTYSSALFVSLALLLLSLL